MGRPLLVMGFGPFMEIADNPAARLARAVDRRDIAGRRVIGVEMPVSYDRAPAITLDLVERSGPCLVLGVGVAANRQEVTVERRGRRPRATGAVDVDGRRWVERAQEGGRPEVLDASIDVDLLAAALGARASEDAGDYVCNAWLYRVREALGTSPPVGFVHLPPAGMEPLRFLCGLRALLAPAPSVG